jgi:hypothetical protein
MQNFEANQASDGKKTVWNREYNLNLIILYKRTTKDRISLKVKIKFPSSKLND